MTSEVLRSSIRHASDEQLALLHMVPDLPRRPSVLIEKNGRGEEYCTVRYYLPGAAGQRGRQESVYIGRLAEDEVQMLKTEIEVCWILKSAQPPTKALRSCVREYRSLRDQYMDGAVNAGKACGFTLHGYQLRRSRESASDTSLDRRSALEELVAHLSLACKYNGLLYAGELSLLYLTLSGSGRANKKQVAGSLSAAVRRRILTVLHLRRVWINLHEAIAKAEEARNQERCAA